MNWAELQRDWKTAACLLQTYWKELTDEELERMDGRRDQLAAALRRRYHYGEEAAERAICTFEKEVRFPGAVK